MRFESVHNVQIPKIGFGTWGIGGGSSPRPSEDAHWLAVLKSALELGYTHFDTAEKYAEGHAETLLGRAVQASGLKRDGLFITTKVWPNHVRHGEVLRACAGSLRRLAMDYIDLYLIHWPSQSVALKDTFRGLNALVKSGQVRHVGVSNFDLPLLKQAQAESETPIFTNQVPYNLSDRSYAQNGVLEYCQENQILLTAYSPVKYGSLRADETLKAIAAAHSATPPQIALAWLVAQERVITIPMSSDAKHQAENLQAADIVLSPEEMARLTRES
ncbi:MAG TPA: aldo/keto reductase [Anaerolineales bacterium]